MDVSDHVRWPGQTGSQPPTIIQHGLHQNWKMKQKHHVASSPGSSLPESLLNVPPSHTCVTNINVLEGRPRCIRCSDPIMGSIRRGRMGARISASKNTVISGILGFLVAAWNEQGRKPTGIVICTEPTNTCKWILRSAFNARNCLQRGAFYATCGSVLFISVLWVAHHDASVPLPASIQDHDGSEGRDLSKGAVVGHVIPGPFAHG